MRLLRLRVRSADEWRGYFASGPHANRLFVPTTARVADGEQVLVEVSGPSLPNKVVIRADVEKWQPALPRLRVRAGASVQLVDGEAHKRAFIDDALAGRLVAIPRRKHDRFPVTVPVRFRAGDRVEAVDGTLIEIGAGGALLTAATIPMVESEVLLELVPPGAVVPMTVAARVSYHTPTGAAGVRFVSRDSDGARRLRELVRRLVAE